MSAISGNTTEEGGSATFTIVLKTIPSADVNITLSSSDPTEGNVSPTSLTFTSSTWNTLQTFTVTGVDDNIVDGKQDYTIIIGLSNSYDDSYQGLDPADVNVTNTDNDNYYCRYTNGHSQASECSKFIGDWSEAEATEKCNHMFVGTENSALSTDPCVINSDVLGSCLIPEGNRFILTTYYPGGLITAQIASDFCANYFQGTWYEGNTTPGDIDLTNGPTQEALDAMVSDALVTVSPECPDLESTCTKDLIESDAGFVFSPNSGGETKGLILYPGAFVDSRAYAPLAKAIAASGCRVFVVPPKNDMVLSDFVRVSRVTAGIVNDASNSQITHWFLSGHSMGGSAAVKYVFQNPTQFQGLILLATSLGPSDAADKDISTNNSISVMLIYGTRDGIGSEEARLNSKPYLPPTTTFVRLIGGNHSQFAYYGLQDGDLEPGITHAHQQELIVAASRYLMNSVANGPGDTNATAGVDPVWLASAATKDPDWPREVQRIIANIENDFPLEKIKATEWDAIGDSFATSKPTTDANAVPPVNVHYYRYQYGNPDDLTLPPVYEGEFWVKSENQQDLIDKLGLTATSSMNLCSAANDALIDWALTLTGQSRADPAYVDNNQDIMTGFQWLAADLAFTGAPGSYILSSPYLSVASDDTSVPEEARGVLYCKVWSPYRAIVWALKGR